MPVIQRNDGDRTFKQAVTDIVERWKARNPEGWRLFCEGQRMSSSQVFGGEDKANLARVSARIPRQIYEAIDMLTGPLDTIERDEARWKWLKEAYPQFFIERKNRIL